MVACLLIANGSILSFGSSGIFSDDHGGEIAKVYDWCFSGLYVAHYFFTERLLNEDELKIIQRVIVWEITCNEIDDDDRPEGYDSLFCFTSLITSIEESLLDDDEIKVDDNEIDEAEAGFIEVNSACSQKSKKHLRSEDSCALLEPQNATMIEPPTINENSVRKAGFDFHDRIQNSLRIRKKYHLHVTKQVLQRRRFNKLRVLKENNMLIRLKELVGNDLITNFHIYKQLSDEFEFRKELKKSLPKKRFTNEEMIGFLNSLKSLPSGINDESIEINDRWYRNRPDRAVKLTGSNPSPWITRLIATPPDFHSEEFQAEVIRIGRYQAITLIAARHYYQYPHPNRANAILSAGPKPYYRQCHGIDHALRTQLATEFILQLLPDHSGEYEALFRKYPDLRELLPIAELYHDAVADRAYASIRYLCALLFSVTNLKNTTSVA